MERDPEELRKLGNAFSDGLAKWLGISAAATVVTGVAAGAAIMHHRAERAKSPESYDEQLAILEDPDKLGMFLPQTRDLALRDINHIAAILLVNDRLTWHSWHLKSGLFEKRFRQLQGLLQSKQLAIKPETNIPHPTFEPQLPLFVAMERPDRYKRLAKALEPLVEAGATVKEL